MSNCKYLIEDGSGNFVIEIPTISSLQNVKDFKTSFYNYLSSVEIKDFLSSLKEIDKKLVIPEQVNGIVLGQDSLNSVFENFKNTDLKIKFRYLSKVLTELWRTKKDDKWRNPVTIQNIVFCAFDEGLDYQYDSKNDIVYINIVNGINKDDILKASLERAAHLFGFTGNIKNKLKSGDTEILNALGITNTSPITPSYLNSLYFNDSDVKRIPIEDFIGFKKDSYIIIREKFGTLSDSNNRDTNYEPVNAELVYNLKQGDLVNILVDKELNKNKTSSSSYYSLFVDYYINSDGKYVIKTISPNSTYPETTILDTPEVMVRRNSVENKYEKVEINPKAAMFTLKIPKDLYFSNKFIYYFLKPGDKITIGATDYTILNLKGSWFNVINSKGEETTIKPSNQIVGVKLSQEAHPELGLERITDNYKQIAVNSANDKTFIQELDIVKYDKDTKTGLVLYKVKNVVFLKNLDTGKLESILDVSISSHYVNYTGNKSLLSNFEEVSKELRSIDPFVYGDWLESNFNYIEYYQDFQIERGDYIINGSKIYSVIDSNNNLFRVYDGKHYIFLNPSNLTNAIIATKRSQDEQLGKISLNKNAYFISNKSDIYPNNYRVKVIKNTNTGGTKVVPFDTPLKAHHVDISKEIKLARGFNENDPIYAFTDKNGIAVKNSEKSIPIINADQNFGQIFQDIIPGTFVRYYDDLKYWNVEKKIKDTYVISHSFYRDNELLTVKRLLKANDKIAEVRVPVYATKVAEKMNGTKASFNINENQLNEYDSPEVLAQMSELLNKKFNINIKLINSSELEDLGVSPELYSARAFVLNGEYYVNIDKSSISDPLHEFLHVILASMKASDPDVYTTLIESVKEHPLFEEVSKTYTEVNSDKLEETFIRLLTDTVRHKILHQGVFTEDAFDFAVKESIKNMFNLNKDLSDEYSLDLMGMKLGEVLNNFGSSLIDFRESMYDKEKAQQVIRVSSVMRNLLKSGNLKENCNG